MAVGGTAPAFATHGGGDTSSASYWKTQYPNAVECYKYGSSSTNNSHGFLAGNGRSVTLKTFVDSWPGDRWEVLVVKGGTLDIGHGAGIAVYPLPSAGAAYTAPTASGGTPPKVDHWIVCKGQTPPEVDEELVVPSASSAPITCDTAGSYTLDGIDGVVWFVAVGSNDPSAFVETAPGTYPVSAAVTV